MSVACATCPVRDRAACAVLSGEERDQLARSGRHRVLELADPAVPGVGLSPSVAELGFFKPDDVDLSAVAKQIPTAQKIFNEVGWK